MYDSEDDAPRPKRKGLGIVLDMGAETEGAELEESGEMPPEVYDALSRAMPDAEDSQIEALYEAIKLCKE